MRGVVSDCRRLGFPVFLLVFVVAVAPSEAQKLTGHHRDSGANSSRTTDAESPNSKSAARDAADFVLTDARIYTADASRHMAEALAVRGGKIIFVGTAAEAAKLVGPKTKVERAGGKLVLPGLVDSHIHPMGIVDFGGCDLQSKARTLAEMATFVRACIERLRVPEGEWLEVLHWEYGGGNQADPAHPTLRAALDAASTKHPIAVTGWDGHHGAFNSAALALAKNAKGEIVGYSKATIATDFREYKTYIGVDVNGEPTGDVSDQGKRPIRTRFPGGGNHDLLMKSPERLTEL